MSDIITKQTVTKQSFPTVPARFAQIAARHANRIAVSTAATQWTYQELDQRSNAVACRILEHADGASEPIALLMEHGALLIASILGALKAGRLYLALDPVNPAARLATMLGDARTRLLLTDKPNSPLAYSLAQDLMKVMEIDDRATACAASPISGEVFPESGAWLIYTSGSTSAPKGVWQNHRGVVHHTDVYGDLIRLKPEDRLSLLASCSFAASAIALFAALLNGATLCPFHVRSQGVERLAEWLHQQQISVYHSVPTIFRHLMKSLGANRRPESVRLVRISGEPALRSDIEAYREHCPADCLLMHSLSATETGPITSMMIDKQTPLTGWRVPAGHVVSGAKVLLVDENSQVVDSGKEGRIAVCSAYLAQGYWRQPDLTAETFRTNIHDPQTRVFITGDLGRFLPEGSLEHLGRTDRVVKIRGQRVDLEEVEAALQATGIFEEAAATAPEDASGEHQLVAYIVPRDRRQVTSQDCRRSLRQSLPEHMVPNDFVPLACLPQTLGGKVDRLALPRLRGHAISHSNTKRTVSTLWFRNRNGSRRRRPLDGIEKKLTDIWETALGVSPIKRHDDFFDLGGTSLQSAQVLAGIEETFNVALSPSTLTEYGTIEALAPWLANHSVLSSPSPLVQLSSSASGRPLFLIHNGQGNVTTYGQLVRRLPDRPIYGLQAIGLQGEGWPLMSIPAMARRYLQEVLAIDSTGPYLLAGTCMGGLIAFEMAQQLVRQGRPVGLVALLDSNHPGPRLSLAELVEDTVRDTFRMLRGLFMHSLGLARRTRYLPAYRSFVVNMTSRANRFYWPVSYPGTITLIVTIDTTYPGQDLRQMMAQHGRQVRVIKIPGQRKDLFVRPVVEELARQMQNCLNACQDSKPIQMQPAKAPPLY